MGYTYLLLLREEAQVNLGLSAAPQYSKQVRYGSNYLRVGVAGKLPLKKKIARARFRPNVKFNNHFIFQGLVLGV